MSLLGPNGRPVASSNFKKANPPKLGPAFGEWAGRDAMYNQLPGGGVMQFDLSRLTLADFRAMRDHPQINSSLAVLTFMMHGLDWRIECENQKIATMIEANLRDVWTRLIRGCSQAYWAGFSPMAIEYENDLQSKNIVISKFKDLVPEECAVNWAKVDGWAPPGHVAPQFKVFDGIKQRGASYPIPVENSLHYPLLMENGDYYGKKLLRPAFSAWYFSILMHLFSNRYFERFGEPVPVGRADFDAEIDAGGGEIMTGREAMEQILMNLRNRGVVVLPHDRDPVTKEYEYDIQYLESQMRGVDFERYLNRLDEEMSLAIFTPVLLLRTADVGSYNLGIGHMQMYLWMLNALAGDLKEYIDKYVIRRLKDFNFGVNAPDAYWVYRKMGKDNVETVRAIVQGLISKDKVTVDLEELGAAVGLSVQEVREVTQRDQEPSGDDGIPEDDKRIRASEGPNGVGQPRATAKQISARIRSQVEKAWKERTFGKEFQPSLGYRRRFEEALKAEGTSGGEATRLTEGFYSRINLWMREAIDLGASEYAGPDDFMAMFERLLDVEIDRLQSGKY